LNMNLNDADYELLEHERMLMTNYWDGNVC